MLFHHALATFSKRISCIVLIKTIGLAIVLPGFSFAQGVVKDNLLEVEALYDQFDAQERVRKVKKKKPKKVTTKRVLEETKEEKVKRLSELSTLAPFADIAVIQKRFLPKSNRYELNASLSNSINNQFFNNFGLEFRAAYYFSEHWGVEGTASFLLESNRDITDNLVDKQRIDTKSLVVPKSYLGAAVKWSPIYGKIALLNEEIVPFDTYFMLGGGMTKIGTGNSEPTLSVGLGQLYAYSKKMAFRWDFTLNNYKATVTETLSGGGTQETSLNQFDLFLSAGVSFFFPEAKYR